MIIKTDFHMGQTVYLINQKKTASKYRCHVCLGTKVHQKLYQDPLGKSVVCNSCSDTGAFYLHYWYFEQEVIVRHITAIMNIDEYGGPIELSIYYSEFPNGENEDSCEQYIYRDRMFASKEVALQECLHRNRLINKDYEMGNLTRGKRIDIVVLDELSEGKHK